MATDLKVIQMQLDAINDGQVARYQLPQFRGGDIVIVELNNTGKGKKYNVWLEKTEAGKPTGVKTRALNTDKTKEIASYIKDLSGEAIK
jgi:hypothetical protein